MNAFLELLQHARRDMLGQAIDYGLSELEPAEAARLITLNEEWFWAYPQECRYFKCPDDDGGLCFQCGATVFYALPDYTPENDLRIPDDVYALELGWAHYDITAAGPEWNKVETGVYDIDSCEPKVVLPVLLRITPEAIKMPDAVPGEGEDLDIFGPDSHAVPLREFREKVAALYQIKPNERPTRRTSHKRAAATQLDAAAATSPRQQVPPHGGAEPAAPTRMESGDTENRNNA